MVLWVFGTTIFTMLVYWTVGTLYTFMDLTNRPACLRKYKIQPGTNEPVEVRRLLKVMQSIDRSRNWYSIDPTVWPLRIPGDLVRGLQPDIRGHTIGLCQLPTNGDPWTERHSWPAHIPLGLLRADRVHPDGGAGILLFAPSATPQAHLQVHP